MNTESTETIKIISIGVVLAILGVGGMLFFELNLGVPRLVWVGLPFVVFLGFTIMPKWHGLNTDQKIMAALLMIPIALLVIAAIIDAYIIEYYKYSSLHILLAFVPFIIYGAWNTLKINGNRKES